MGGLRAVRSIIVAAFLLLFPLSASADDRERGQELFAEAAGARDDGRWEDARRLLEESLSVYPHFPTAWNLVAALEATDDLPAAERLLERILGGEYGNLETAERGSVTERLEAVAAQLGTVVVNVPPDAGATISVDDAEPSRADASGRLVLRLPAGPARVRARGEGISEVRSVDVVATETVTVRFELSAPLERQPSNDEESDAGSVWTSPWLWITVGLLIAGGAVATGIVLGTGNEDPVGADFMTPPL
jgi:hypothetical protein